MHSLMENIIMLACLFAFHGHVIGDGQNCEGAERPHERGLCGWRLAQAHSNLCFLLREVYHREFYHPLTERTKRSSRLDANTKGLVEKIYSIPLDVLADLDLSKDDWHGLLVKKSTTNKVHETITTNHRGQPDFGERVAVRPIHLRSSNALSRRIARLMLQASSANEKGLMSSADVKMAAAARGRSRRSVVSGMVCDCCYNQCSPEELGTYC